MSEEQKAKYEEAAELQIKNVPSIHSNLKLVEKLRFIEGTEHAHPIGFNLGKEEGKKEGYNSALDDVEALLRNGRGTDIQWKQWFNDELQKLRK